MSGSKVKLAIFTSTSAASECEGSSRSTRAPSATIFASKFVMDCLRLACERCVGDGKGLVANPHRDAGDAEHGAKLICRHCHWPWGRRRARDRLWEACRARGMEGDCSFRLLHDLMDVAVEHRHRAEAFRHVERLQAVTGAPTPVGINCPQWDMGEHHDRRRIRLVPDVVVEPRELLRSQPAESSGFE